MIFISEATSPTVPHAGASEQPVAFRQLATGINSTESEMKPNLEQLAELFLSLTWAEMEEFCQQIVYFNTDNTTEDPEITSSDYASAINEWAKVETGEGS